MLRSAFTRGGCLLVLALALMDCGGAGKPNFVQAETATVQSKTDVPGPPPKVLIKYSYRVKGETTDRPGEALVGANDPRAPLEPNNPAAVCYEEGKPQTPYLLLPSGNCDDLQLEVK